MGNMKNFEKPEKQYRPDVRWWLAEGFHTDQTLKNDIRLLDEAGFGAVEFLAMEEPGADSKLYGWGSEEWVHDSATIFKETTKRKMGVSATCGTNWSNANLITIDPDHKAASKELDFVTETLKAGESRTGAIPKCELHMPGVTKQDLIAVVAAKKAGEKDKKEYLEKETIVLTDKVQNGELTWIAPEDGEYLVFYFWIHGTGQTAAPSVSTSYTVNYIDHYGIDAFIEYWDDVVLTPELKETIKENGRAMMYMDSLELSTFSKGGQLWGYNFLTEFEKRRGYDVTAYLPFVVKYAGMMIADFVYRYYMEDALFSEKLYNDLYQTMTDMYMDNMMKPMQDWLHKNNMFLRSEISYGLPFEISQPGKYVDGVETESLEFASQIESYRGLAGTAHIYDHIYSSETGATQMNYMKGMDFYTQIIYTQFAAGVTRTVLHGYSSIAGSEDSTAWPGHEGMWPVFSERFGCRQPAYQHYNDWTDMLARYQMVLRQGKPRMDLGFLRIDYNFNNLLFLDVPSELEMYEQKLMRGHEGMYWKDMSLQDAGYTWDYFAPQLLEEDFVDTIDGVLLPDGPGYQALVIYQEGLPVESAKKILEMADKGLPVVFVNGVNETIRPGGVNKTHKKAASMTPFNDGKDGELAEIVTKIKALPTTKEIDCQGQTINALRELNIRPRAGFAAPNQNILPLMRKDGDKIYVYVYNMMYTDKENCSFTLVADGEGKPYWLDCWNGKTEEVSCYRTENGKTLLDITLAPGEARVYAIDLAAEKEVHPVAKENGCIEKTESGYIFRAYVNGTGKVAYSDGTVKEVFAENVPADIALPKWNLIVEDWNVGDKKTIIEDRGKGIVTREVYYETSKAKIRAGEVELKPWKDLEKVGGEVSGVGYYSTKVTLSEEFLKECGAVLEIESVNAGSGAVYVNGTKIGGFDFDRKKEDITKWLKAGENQITIEVSTTLNNRLLARGYYDMVGEMSRMLSDNANNGFESNDDKEDNTGLAFNVSTDVKDYGMTGEVRLHTYKKIAL